MTPILRTLHFDNRAAPIDQFQSWLERGELDLDAPYQRGSVWGDRRKRNLIRSLTMGLPIGAIFINERRYPEGYVVIDGKQRILAMRSWFRGKLEVPRDWFPNELVKWTVDDVGHTTVTFDDLLPTGQRMFRNAGTVATYIAHLRTVEEEEELFDLINFGGVPQGERDNDLEEVKQ